MTKGKGLGHRWWTGHVRLREQFLTSDGRCTIDVKQEGVPTNRAVPEL